MSLTDELCASFRDLEGHFDPSSEGRLGRFDAGSVGEHLAAFRAIEAGVEELEVEDSADEIDRTALLDDIRIAIFRYQHERPHVRNPGFWLSHLCDALWTDGRKDGRTDRSVELLKSIPPYLLGAEKTLKDPPSIFIDFARSLVRVLGRPDHGARARDGRGPCAARRGPGGRSCIGAVLRRSRNGIVGGRRGAPARRGGRAVRAGAAFSLCGPGRGGGSVALLAPSHRGAGRDTEG